jgi:hypothetical protein
MSREYKGVAQFTTIDVVASGRLGDAVQGECDEMCGLRAGIWTFAQLCWTAFGGGIEYCFYRSAAADRCEAGLLYLGEAWKIARWDDLAIRRSSKDSKATTYGVLF